MSYEKDWTTWAGDNPQEAEAELRAERERAEASFARVIRAGLLQPAHNHEYMLCSAACETCGEPRDTQYLTTCEVEGHEFHVGVCLICEEPDEDYEPSDAQIPGTYEIRKAAA
jgi:hypothetical protein